MSSFREGKQRGLSLLLGASDPCRSIPGAVSWTAFPTACLRLRSTPHHFQWREETNPPGSVRLCHLQNDDGTHRKGEGGRELRWLGRRPRLQVDVAEKGPH